MGYLASGESGLTLILWKEAGTGEKWALVKIGMPSAEADTTVFPAKIISSQGSAVYTVREQVHNSQDGLIDKPGVDDVSATNLAELSQGTGSAVDVGPDRLGQLQRQLGGWLKPVLPQENFSMPSTWMTPSAPSLGSPKPCLARGNPSRIKSDQEGSHLQ